MTWTMQFVVKKLVVCVSKVCSKHCICTYLYSSLPSFHPSSVRDFLHTNYKSSSKAKHAKKVAEKKEVGIEVRRRTPKQAVAEVVSEPKCSPPASVQEQPRPSSKTVSFRARTVVAAQQQPASPNTGLDDSITFYDIDDLNLMKLDPEE